MVLQVYLKKPLPVKGLFVSSMVGNERAGSRINSGAFDHTTFTKNQYLTNGCPGFTRQARFRVTPISHLAFLSTPGQVPDATAIGALSVATKHAALHALIEPVVTAMGFELWGVDHLSQGKHSRLVIYIERESGVSVDDCADISRQVSAVLDVEDPIPGEYRLEVSSPGMARPLYTLDHFTRYVGHQVALKLRTPFDGRRKFSGLIAGVEEDEVLLHMDGEEFCFPIESIDQATIVPQFDD